MAKQSGLGDNFYVGGYDLSGDVGSLGSISSPRQVTEVTGINKSAPERLLLHKDGTIEFTAFHNDAALAEFPALKTLPTTDTQVLYFRGTTLGNSAAAMTAKQINYDWTRPTDGSLTKTVQAQANGFGLEWGNSLTAGIKTDTAATVGTAIDTGGSLSFGCQVYFMVFAFTGTDCLLRVADSGRPAFATILDSSTISAGPTFERKILSNTSTVRRYVRVSSVTGTSITSLSFAVVLVKNEIAGTVF